VSRCARSGIGSLHLQRRRSSHAFRSVKLEVVALPLKTRSLRLFHMVQRIVAAPNCHALSGRGRGERRSQTEKGLAGIGTSSRAQRSDARWQSKNRCHPDSIAGQAAQTFEGAQLL
jgi:hypothetical protein